MNCDSAAPILPKGQVGGAAQGGVQREKCEESEAEAGGGDGVDRRDGLASDLH